MYGTKQILHRFKLIQKVDGNIDEFFNWILAKRFDVSKISYRGNKLSVRRMYFKKEKFLYQTYINWKRFGVIQMELFKNPQQKKLIKELDEYIENRSEIIEQSIKIIEEYNLIYKEKTIFESQVFEVPDTLLTAFQQYFLFFGEYVKTAKDIDIKFEVNKVPNGIFFRFNINESEFIQIQNYLIEYLNFARNNDFHIINIEGTPSIEEIDFLRLRLEQQVYLLQTEIKYKELLINRLEIDNQGLRKENNKFTDRILKSFENLTQKVIKLSDENLDKGIQNEKDVCKQFLRDNKLAELFSYLNLEISSKTDFENELIIIQSQFNRLERDRRIGSIGYEDEMRIQNKIIMSLTQIIDKI